MNQPARTFSLVAFVVIILLFMHHLPTLTVGQTELRPVDVLSDLSRVNRTESKPVAVPKPAAPCTMVPKTVDSKTVEVRERWPHGVEPIVDYATDAAMGMDAFYVKLLQAGHLDTPVRIAYYGDSFIEGDILTCDVREMLQERFGGSGVGWVDLAGDVVDFRRTVYQKQTGLTGHAIMQRPFSMALQSLAQRYAVADEGATVTFVGSKYRKHIGSWQTARLFLYAPEAIRLSVAVPGDTAYQTEVGGAPGVSVHETAVATRRISYAFHQLSAGTRLYGVALESHRGVIVDNFSMRGSDGASLSKLPPAMLGDFARLRPYQLIVLHFGLNEAVRGNKDANFRIYTNKMKRTITLFRKMFPQAAILVVSVSDRDDRTPDGIRTLPEVPRLVAFQQQMAADTHVAFYNLFEAMGGPESMQQLVDKRLANKDYTHLSFGGGRVLARKMVASLLAGVENYKRKKALEQP